MSVDDANAVLETYLNIAFSFSRGVVRIWGAEAASARLLCALKEFQSLDHSSVQGPAAAVLGHLAGIPYNSIDSIVHVSNVSHFLYAATLFDTFLSETTQFLFLLLPRAMGEEQPVPLRALIDAASKREAIAQAASARAREVGYLPFAARIQFLRETFGLEITISPETIAGLNRFSSARDNAESDQGSFHLQLGDRGDIVPRAKGSEVNPWTKIGGDVHWAVDSYEQAARAIARAVFTQVLKRSDHPAVQLALIGSTAKVSLNAS